MELNTKQRILISGFSLGGLQAIFESVNCAYDQLAATDKSGQLLESVTMEEIEHAYLGTGEILYQRSAMFEAITTERQQLAQTMRAFTKVLNRGLNGTNISAGVENSQDQDNTGSVVGGAIISKVRRVAGIPVIAAKIPLSDGQSTSIVFHSPTSNGKTVANGDLLVAFQFLINKRDVTHTVAPIGGKDVSLAQVAQSLSNLIEKNSGKFNKQKDIQNKTKAEIDSMNNDADKLESQRSDLMKQLNDADAQVTQVSSQVDTLTQSLASQKAINAALQQQLEKITSTPAPQPAAGSEITDNLRTVKSNINMDGTSKLSDGSVMRVVTVDAGDPETFVMLQTPDDKKYQLMAKSMQGTDIGDAVGKLFKAYRGGTAKKYQVDETAEDQAKAANAAAGATAATTDAGEDNAAATGTTGEPAPETDAEAPPEAGPAPAPEPAPQPDAIPDPVQDNTGGRTYRYALTLRPAGPGAVPAGNVGLIPSEKGDPYAKYARYGYIEYPQALSDKDTAQFDLTYIPTQAEYVNDAQKLAQEEFSDRAEAMIEFETEQPKMFNKTVQIRFRNVFPDVAAPQGEDATAFNQAFSAALEAIANPDGSNETPPTTDPAAGTESTEDTGTEQPPATDNTDPAPPETDPLNPPTTETPAPATEQAAEPVPDTSGNHDPDPIDMQQMNVEAIANITGRSADAVSQWWEVNGNGPDGLASIKNALESAPTQQNIDALNNAIDFGTAFSAAAVKPEEAEPAAPDTGDSPGDDSGTEDAASGPAASDAENNLTGNDGGDVPEVDQQTNGAISALKAMLNYQSDDIDAIQGKIQEAQNAANALVSAGEYDANESLVNDVATNLIGLLAAIQQQQGAA